MKRLVLLGGGHSHVEVLRRLGSDPVSGAQITLVSPYLHMFYSGMLPGWIAGHYTDDDCRIDLAALAGYANASFVQTACNGIDPVACRVFGENGATLPYDVLSVDTGGRSPALDTPGAVEHALSVRPVERFMPLWAELLDRVAHGHSPRRIAVVGGGAGGVETLLAIHRRMCAVAPTPAVEFVLVSDEDGILASHNGGVRAIFKRVLEERGVTLHLGRGVLRVESGVLRLAGGGSVEAEAIIWATGASAPSWLQTTDLATDERGFLRVNGRLQSVSHPQVFAAGDVASVDGHPRPKSGVYAVRAGPPLAVNLRRRLRGERLVEWTPPRDALALISTGDRYAVASRGRFALEGRWVWRWKDWIDRTFMKRYRNP